MNILNPEKWNLPRSLILGIVALVVFFAVGVWWVLRPSWVVLYQGASESARAEVAALLDRKGIAYQTGPEGAIEVAQAQLAAARGQMAEAGLPGKPATGYELFDNADYGMSEFAQKINFQRALEGELARSIMSLREVRAARVHLTLKKNSLYSAQQESAKASVVLQLHTGMMLERKQVQGIQQLVASSVEGLSPEAVVVIDEAGLPLNSFQSFGAFDDRWQLASRIESELQAKAQQVLDSTYGASNARASVRVQMNFDRVRTVKELPLSSDGDGNGIVLREKQVQSSDNSKDADGRGSNGRSDQTDETEYVVGKDRSETEVTPGRIERITVGIVLSDKLPVVDSNVLGNLMTAALGLSEERGDSLSIALLPMQAPAPDVAPLAATTAQRLPAGDKPLSPWWLLIAGLLAGGLGVTLLGLLRRRDAVAPAAVSSPAERERLLQDVRSWLAGDAQDGLS
jgi:flagellar M-ring protein FliF